MNIVTDWVKQIANKFGFDIIRTKNKPAVTLLGLRTLPINTIIDVGANVGQFAKYAMNRFPQAKIYCFEPLPEPYEKLRSWADHRGGGVTVFNMAIGEKTGSADMFYYLEQSPSSSFLEATKLANMLYPATEHRERISVDMMTLDEAVHTKNMELDGDILIKLDVQGFEDRVIKGGQLTFQKAKACILEVCLDSLYEKQAGFKDLLFLMDELGYHYCGNLDQAYGEDGHCIFFDAVFMK